MNETSSPVRFGCRILDVRSPDRCARDHVPNSAQIPVAGDEPGEIHAAFLPAKPVLFSVLSESVAKTRNVVQALVQRGYRASPFDPSGVTWTPGPARGALWSPDPFLVECLDRLPSPTTGPVIDLGAGTGRDSVFLAIHGYDCLLVDRLPDALDLARRRAEGLGVTIRTEELDLRTARPAATDASLVLSIRYFDPEVLLELARVVRPGSMFLLRTFGPGPDDSRPFSSRHRVSPSAVEDLFPEDCWETLVPARVEVESDHPWLQCLVRRRETP